MDSRTMFGSAGRLSVLLALASLLSACPFLEIEIDDGTDSGRRRPRDGSVTGDAGPNGRDGATSDEDGGSTTDSDAGTTVDPDVDGGTSDTDASPSDMDASPSDMDAGSADLDAAVPDIDSGPLAPETAMVEPGAEVAVGPVVITTGEGDLSSPIMVTAMVAPLPAPLPEGVTPAGDNLDIHVSDQDAITAPLTIRAHYNPALVPEGQLPVVLHYDDVLGYQPTTTIAVDTATATITFETRGFSNLAPSVIPDPPELFPGDFVLTEDTLQIENTGGGPTGGNCLGMTAVAAWYRAQRRTDVSLDPLAGRFSDEVARVLAIRAQIDAHGLWNDIPIDSFHGFDADAVKRLKQQIVVAGPQVIAIHANLIRGTTRLLDARHAILAYGYDREGIWFYDPNFRNTTLRVPLVDGALPSSFSTPAGAPYFENVFYTSVGASSIGSIQDFMGLLAEAEDGFTPGTGITLTAPTPDLMFSGRTLDFAGTFASTIPDTARTYVFAWGHMFDIPTTDRTFAGTIAAVRGDTELYVLAAPRASEARALLRNSAVQQITVHNDAPPVELATLMTWNSNASDIDLYVTAPDRRSIWNGLPWSDLGNRPIDDSDGFGPEYIAISPTDPAGPPYVVQNGTYAVRAHLFRNDRGDGHSIQASILIITGEGTERERVINCTFNISHADSANRFPDGTGSDWRDVAWIEISGAPAAPTARILSGRGSSGRFCPMADALGPP